MPARCVLNGLQTVPIPPELAVLDQLSRQLNSVPSAIRLL